MNRIIISGGGTGGHIFPAIAIANALKALRPEADILFIGAKGKMEMEKVPQAGYRIVGLTISGFQRRLTWKNLLFPFRLMSALIKARKVITDFRPDLVIGVGGYASGPTLRIAAKKGIPCLIQEQNSFPGVTNRLLAPVVKKICVAYEGMEKYFPADKIVLTGNPVRKALLANTTLVHEAATFFGFEAGRKTVLSIGGSLGAGTLNNAMTNFIKKFDHQTDKYAVQVLWQTGTYYYPSVLRDLENFFACSSSENDPGTNASTVNQGTAFKTADGLLRIVVRPFIDRMDYAYSIADLVISRAGALAISELCVAGKPSVLIPSPNVAEDHQTKNAKALVEREAAMMISDAEATEKLGSVIEQVLKDDLLRERLSRNINRLGYPDAADRIAGEALKLMTP